MTHNIVSISGGKDSTATLLLAIALEVENLQAVFADTGHEHALTYEYIEYLEQRLGLNVRRVKADFTRQIERKRETVANKWPADLMRGVDGFWEWDGTTVIRDGFRLPYNPLTNAVVANPKKPDDQYRVHIERRASGRFIWTPGRKPMTEDEAAAVVETALAVFKPTGNPFLDLCILKGRFPSSQARFCTDELKRDPIINQVLLPMMDKGEMILSWQGVRRDESPNRRYLPECDEVGGGLFNYRPILKWNVESVFEAHRYMGVKPNPLYSQGAGRVGCMPCIMCRKEELRQIAERWPEEIARVREWEQIVSCASKIGSSTLFNVCSDPTTDRNELVDATTHGIDRMVEWAKTDRGGRQYSLIQILEESKACSSQYGLCE